MTNKNEKRENIIAHATSPVSKTPNISFSNSTHFLRFSFEYSKKSIGNLLYSYENRKKCVELIKEILGILDTGEVAWAIIFSLFSFLLFNNEKTTPLGLWTFDLLIFNFGICLINYVKFINF